MWCRHATVSQARDLLFTFLLFHNCLPSFILGLARPTTHRCQLCIRNPDTRAILLVVICHGHNTVHTATATHRTHGLHHHLIRPKQLLPQCLSHDKVAPPSFPRPAACMAVRTSRRTGRDEMERHGQVAYPTHAAPSSICCSRTKVVARIDAGSIFIVTIVILNTAGPIVDPAYAL